MSWIESAAGGDVQHLHPAADCEERHIAVERAPGKIDLELIATRLGVVDGRMALLLVEHRVHVPSAGEEHAADFADDRTGTLGHFQNTRRRPCGLDRCDVVVQAAAAGHTDDGGHISSQTSQSVFSRQLSAISSAISKQLSISSSEF